MLRAFENACRHRGHELLPCGGSAQSAKAIVCPYHAWTYRFDGSLLGAPGFKDVDDFDKSTLGLKTVPVHEWHGWIFVDRTGRGPAFEEHIGELEAIVAPYDAATLVTAGRPRVRRGGQLEGGHRELPGVLPLLEHPPRAVPGEPARQRREHRAGRRLGRGLDGPAHGVETMSLDGRSGGVAMARLDEHEKRTVMYVAVLPNLLISLHPDYVMTHLLTPLSPDRTRIRCSWAFPADVAGAEGFDPSYAIDFWDLTNRQDWAACESVQRGMKAPGYEAGLLAPDEDGVYQFVSRIAKAYRGTS